MTADAANHNVKWSIMMADVAIHSVKWNIMMADVHFSRAGSQKVVGADRARPMLTFCVRAHGKSERQVVADGRVLGMSGAARGSPGRDAALF